MSRGRRDSDHKRPTKVTLYLKGNEVGSFQLPWSDPRFVKPDDLMKSAREMAATRPSRREDDRPIPQEWDRIRFHWGFGTFTTDRAGNNIWDEA